MSGSPRIKPGIFKSQRIGHDECAVVVNGHDSIGLHTRAQDIISRERHIGSLKWRPIVQNRVKTVDDDLGGSAAVVTHIHQPAGLCAAIGL